MGEVDRRRLAAKLAAVGLIPPRTTRTLAAFLDAYLTGRRADGATARGTLDNIEQVRNDLVAHFGAGLDLRALTRERAEGFKLYYQTTCGLATTTVARRLGAVRTIFESGVRSEVLPVNPFSRVSGQYIPRKERARYVTVEDILKVLDVVPPVWRMIIALSRFAGLRSPSEVLSLRWADMNFAEDRMTVPEPKNARHPGREYRVVPIFHRLKPYLQDAYELARPGEEFVISGPLATRLRNAVGFANGGSAGAVEERQPRQAVQGLHPPGGPDAVAASFSQHAGELRNGPDAGPPDSRCFGVAGQLSKDRTSALPPGGAGRFREGGGGRCGKRCSRGADSGSGVREH